MQNFKIKQKTKYSYAVTSIILENKLIFFRGFYHGDIMSEGEGHSLTLTNEHYNEKWAFKRE